MAHLSDAVIARLNAVGAVTAIFGSGATQRIHWKVRPQGEAPPALVLTAAGGEPDDLDLDGNADWSESRIQGSCLAGSYREARAGIKAFSDALMGAFDAGGLQFWDGYRERPVDLGGEAAAGGFIHEVTQDVILRHTPAA